MNSIRQVLWVSLVAVLMASGCGKSGPTLAPVSGTLRVGDVPVPYATVTFVPKGDVGSGPSSGVTDKDGNFKLGYSRDTTGAFVGEHDVTIRPIDAPDAETKSALKASGIDVSTLPKVPKKYLSPGVLSAEVKKGQNTFDFKLDAE